MNEIDFEFNGEILCIGSVNMDLVMNIEHFCVPGETVLASAFSTFPGGKGGNQAVAASRLSGDIKNSKVQMFCRLGDDDFSSRLKESLTESGVNVKNIIIETNNTSGVAMIRVDKSGQNSISIFPGCNSNFLSNDIKCNESLFKAGKMLLINMEIPLETIYKSIKTAKRNGMFVILDPAPAPTTPIPQEIIECIDIIKPNETEAGIITGIKICNEDDAIRALYKLREMGFKIPIITMGKSGVITLNGTNILKVKALKISAVDTTAAGDVFSGGLTSMLASGSDLSNALEFANVAAALSATKHGAQASIPLKKEVLDFISSN